MGENRRGADFMNNIVDAGKKTYGLASIAQDYLITLKPDVRATVEKLIRGLNIYVGDLGNVVLSLGNASVEVLKLEEQYLSYIVELLLRRAEVKVRDLGLVVYVLTQIIRDYLREFWRKEESITVKISHVSERENLYYEIVEKILSNNIIKTFYITTTSGEYEVGMYCWNGVVYTPCDKTIEAEIENLASENKDVSKKTTRWIVNEALAKIKRKTLTKLHYEPLAIVFKNGLVLDWKAFLKTGSLRTSLLKANPDIIVFHLIPHKLRVERLEEALKGLEKFDESMVQTVEDVERLAEKLCPKSLKTFKEWVGEKWILLFEIIGYTLYPKYDMHKAVMLVGEGNNGKSTYLSLIRDILGSQNVSDVKLQDLCGKNERFMTVQLYRKLANIHADLPSEALRHTGVFKVLTGEDAITADRKNKTPITFVNYAKLIFSANELPPVKDMTRAFWRRWLVIKFPNQFPLNPEFYEETFTEEEKEGVILVSLIAFRLAWKRRKFSFEETEADYKRLWLRETNSVYAFIEDLISEGLDNIRLVRDPNGRAEAGELYGLYVEYCRREDRESFDKRRFTIEMERLGYVKVKVKNKHYYKGLRIEKPGQAELLES